MEQIWPNSWHEKCQCLGDISTILSVAKYMLHHQNHWFHHQKVLSWHPMLTCQASAELLNREACLQPSVVSAAPRCLGWCHPERLQGLPLSGYLEARVADLQPRFFLTVAFKDSYPCHPCHHPLEWNGRLSAPTKWTYRLIQSSAG